MAPSRMETGREKSNGISWIMSSDWMHLSDHLWWTVDKDQILVIKKIKNYLELFRTGPDPVHLVQFIWSSTLHLTSPEQNFRRSCILIPAKVARPRAPVTNSQGISLALPFVWGGGVMKLLNMRCILNGCFWFAWAGWMDRWGSGWSGQLGGRSNVQPIVQSIVQPIVQSNGQLNVQSNDQSSASGRLVVDSVEFESVVRRMAATNGRRARSSGGGKVWISWKMRRMQERERLAKGEHSRLQVDSVRRFY